MWVVSNTFVYPLKSGAAVELTGLTLNEKGVTGDREFMVVDAETGKPVTARTHPMLLRVQTDLTALFHHQNLKLSVGDDVLYEGGVATKPRSRRDVSVWKWQGTGFDQGDAPAEALSWYLNTPVRLVYRMPEFRPQKRANSGSLGFADGYPLLVLSVESLKALKASLPDFTGTWKDLAARFRANVLVAWMGQKETVPWQEEDWWEVAIGETGIRLQGVKRCSRCAMIGMNPVSGVQDMPGLYNHIGAYREENPPYVGVNFNVLSCGIINAGDQVVITEAEASLQRRRRFNDRA